MRIDFPFPGYEQIPPVDVPDANLLGLWQPKRLDHVDETRVLRQAFASPISAPRLRAAARGKSRILILIDDATRFTPTARILPHVIDELHAGGARDENISFLTAQGTHRPMSEDELRKKLGPFFGRYVIQQHHWKDEAQLHTFGHTRDGTLVRANRLLRDSDQVFGIGSITPHRVKGFSGGAKIAFPGVAGPEIMDRQQWEASMQMSETVMGVAENSMRLRMEEAAQMAGLHYIVNVILDGGGKIVGCYVGDVVRAHRAACPLSREITVARLPQRADIVIIDSYPQDRDFWQSAKGLYSGTMAVRDGGTIIMVSPNPEGVASNHPNLLQTGYKKHADIVAMVQSGRVDDLVGIAILADVAQILDKAHVILASPGIKPEDAQTLGMEHAPDANAALEMAFRRHGRGSKVAVLRHGGHILPVADTRAAAACQPGVDRAQPSITRSQHV